MSAPMFQFPLRVEATDDPLGPEAVEELALELREALGDLGATRVDRTPGPPAPDGTRALEVVAAMEFLVTALQAGEALGKLVRALRRLADRYRQRRRAVRLLIAGTEIDLAAATDEDLDRVVRDLLRRPATARTGTRSALIVANAAYDDPTLAQLRSPGHDAQALVRVLGDPAIGGFEAEALVDADERTIRRRVAAFFAGRDRDDVLLLHFSCHGVKDARGRLHLAARDTDLSVLGATSVPASFVNDLLAETQSRRVVLVLDCCYSGAFARGVGVRADEDVHIADEFGAGNGRIVLTASSATEYAFEDGELTRSQGLPSAFTGALVRGLETGEADLDADGEITVDELYDYAYRVVRDSTPGQAPMKWSFGVEGSLVVARSVRPATLPAQILDDLASDRVVLRLEGVRALGRLAVSGRPGQQAAARARLAALRDADDSARVRAAAGEALGDDGPPPPVPPPVVAAPVPRPAPAPAPAPPLTPKVRPSGRGLSVAVGVLLLASAVGYLVGLFAGRPVTNDSLLATLLTAVPYAVVGGLMLARRIRGTGLVAGMLVWEWLFFPLLLHSETLANLPTLQWRLYALGNLAGIAAQACATVSVLRARRPVPLPAVAKALVVLVTAVPLSISAANEFFYANGVEQMSEGSWQRVAVGLLCAAVVGLLPLVAPVPTVRYGWLLGGALLLGQIALELVTFRAGTGFPTVGVLSALLAELLLAVLLMDRRWPERSVERA